MDIVQLAILIGILVYSIILHEIAHGWVADKLGDPTARLSGRLTLDPRPHIDPFTTIILPILSYLFAGVIFGAAKPVPIDPYNFKDQKKDIALSSAAGPITNILIALFFALLLRILPIELFRSAAELNVFLAVLNLLPFPPLDGFKVVGGILPDDMARVWFSFERLGLTFIIILLFFFGSLVNSIIYPISQTILRIILP